MKHVHYQDVKVQEVEEPGAQGATVRWLISQEDGAPNFYMRRFELEPGGRTPHHDHPWEHEVYVLEGSGVVFGDGKESPVQPGDVVYVPPGEEHYLAADAGEGLAFLCLVPPKPAR